MKIRKQHIFTVLIGIINQSVKHIYQTNVIKMSMSLSLIIVI